jgi:SSS family transporter
MGIVLFLPAIVLSTATGINIYLCILLMGILATIYTSMGGIEAVIWTDVIQVFVLMGGALLAFVIIVFQIDGGFGEIVRLGWTSNKFHLADWTWDYTRDALWVIIIGNIFANLIPYTTDQTVVQRYLTTSSEKEAARGIWTNAILTVPATILFFGLGTALFAYYKHFPHQLDPTLPTDAIFPLFIVHLLPAGIAGLIVAGIFAASMSSLDSSLNSMSAVVITDFVNRLKKHRSDGDELKLARWLTIFFGVFGTVTAILLATLNIQSLLDAFREILGLFGGSLGGLFALGIFTKKANGYGALVGAFTSAVLLWFVKTHTQMHFFLYAAVGTVSCFVIGYFMSYFFKNNTTLSN